MTRLDFHFHSAHSRAQHAALNLPFTEHCHGETVKTMPREAESEICMWLKVVCFLFLIVVLWSGLSGLEQELAWRAAV